MGRRSNSEINQDIETEDPCLTEKVTEPEQVAQVTNTVLFSFDDFAVLKQPDGIIVLLKGSGGISDSCYARVATGNEKNWCLYNNDGLLLDTGSVHGNRPFGWKGKLEPGTYRLMTGKGNNRSVHRIPGRSFSVTFTV